MVDFDVLEIDSLCIDTVDGLIAEVTVSIAGEAVTSGVILTLVGNNEVRLVGVVVSASDVSCSGVVLLGEEVTEYAVLPEEKLNL